MINKQLLLWDIQTKHLEKGKKSQKKPRYFI